MIDVYSAGLIDLRSGREVTRVATVPGGFEVRCVSGKTFLTAVAPLLATGFRPPTEGVRHLFSHREDGFPVLNERDESTLTPGLFISPEPLEIYRSWGMFLDDLSCCGQECVC